MPLLPYSDSMQWPQWPYTLTLESNGVRLYYFGEAHSFDPKIPQWDTLRGYWKDYLGNTEKGRRIVFVEGGTHELPSDQSESAAILSDGGAGLGQWLAKEEGILVRSPEPNEAYERSELEKDFSRDEIQYYYFARVVLQWIRTMEPRMPFDQYIQAFLNADKKYSGWDDYDFSLEHMKLLHEQFTGRTFDPTEKQVFYDQSNPANSSTVGGRVSRGSSQVRDTFIVSEIVSQIKNGVSVFAIYGGSHVVIQEPLLREFFEK